MSNQVITIEPDGTVSGLQVKPGKGFDLRSLGAAKIERASEVIWCEPEQRWQVEIRKGAFEGVTVTEDLHQAALRFWETKVHKGTVELTGKPALFVEYEDAVKCEIAVLDMIRLVVGPQALQ